VTDVAQFRVVPQYARQPVIGNTTAEVMHVVNTDVNKRPSVTLRIASPEDVTFA